jgi:hypothetical protein
MNLVKNIEQFNDNFLFFCEPIKNNIINEGNFIKILYSTELITFNGIYLLFNLTDLTCEKYYNKYKCVFNIQSNREIIEKLKLIEENILKKYKSFKNPLFKIYEQLLNGNIKIFDYVDKNNSQFIIKISGIWETTYNYGITYKFCKTNS